MPGRVKWFQTNAGIVGIWGQCLFSSQLFLRLSGPSENKFESSGPPLQGELLVMPAEGIPVHQVLGLRKVELLNNVLFHLWTVDL